MKPVWFYHRYLHFFISAAVWRVYSAASVSFAGTTRITHELRDENFAVANFSGVSRFTDDIDHLFPVGRRRATSPDLLRQEITRTPRRMLRRPFLTAKPFHFGDGQSLNAKLAESASRTSSSLNGLIITVTSFIEPQSEL